MYKFPFHTFDGAADDVVLINGDQRGAALFIMFDPPAVTVMVCTLSGARFANMAGSTIDATNPIEALPATLSTSGNVVTLSGTIDSQDGAVIVATGATNSVLVVDQDALVL